MDGHAPCPPCTAAWEFAGQYQLSFYFINTIFSTVGFGDMFPSFAGERLLAVVLFYIGTVLFAMILAEVESTLAVVRRLSRTMTVCVQGVRELIYVHEMPRALERRVVQWVEFDTGVQFAADAAFKSLNKLAPSLREEVLDYIHGNRLKAVPLFRDLDTQTIYGHRFLLELWSLMQVASFPPAVRLATRGEPAKALSFIHDGTVALVSSDGLKIDDAVTMGAGDFFGENVLMTGVKGTPLTPDMIRMEYHVDTLSFVELFVLSPEVHACMHVWMCICRYEYTHMDIHV